MNLRKEIQKEQYEAVFYQELEENLTLIVENGLLITMKSLGHNTHTTPPEEEYERDCAKIILSALKCNTLNQHFRPITGGDIIGTIQDI